MVTSSGSPPRSTRSGAQRGHRFLCVLRGPPEPPSKMPTDGNVDELLPPGFLEKTKQRGLVWPKRTSQKQVLAHTIMGGFVTHCGWNSVVESLWFGVPMLSWPFGAEQHYNAFALATVMGVAVEMRVDRKRNKFAEAIELERSFKTLMDGVRAASKVRDGAMEIGRGSSAVRMEIKPVCRAALEEDGSLCLSLQKLESGCSCPGARGQFKTGEHGHCYCNCESRTDHRSSKTTC